MKIFSPFENDDVLKTVNDGPELAKELQARLDEVIDQARTEHGARPDFSTVAISALTGTLCQVTGDMSVGQKAQLGESISRLVILAPTHEEREKLGYLKVRED
jgi:hypothetical protein